jgi:transketolase
MAAIINGLSLSKVRAFGATFFIFSDYARPGIRLAALMELPAIFVFTHDAMGDGETGRRTSRSSSWHPARDPRTDHAAARRCERGRRGYRYVMQLRHQPAVMVLSRQPLPTLDRAKYARHPASRAALTSSRMRRAEIRK